MAGQVLRAAVVGGSTLLGRELLSEIGQTSAAAWDLRLLEEDAEAEGQLTAAGDEALVVHALDPDSFGGLDVVFFAGEPALTLRYAAKAVTAGTAVVDLTGAMAGQEGFVLRSPFVSGGQRPDLTTTGICVPHPASVMLGIAGERLQRSLGPGALQATVLEPVSQAGAAGVDELHQQTVNLLSFQDPPRAVFDAQIAFNVQAALGEESTVSLREMRERVRTEVRRLLGEDSPMTVSLQLLQAPVFHGSYISAHVQVDAAVQQEAVEAALAGVPVNTATDLPPSNRTATETGELMVSVDFEGRGAGQESRSFWLQMAADNLGLTARSALAAAVELVALRPTTRVQ